MNKPFRKLIITIIALAMFAVEIPFTGNLTKAQSTSGIVALVFDDGWNSQFNNSFPLMQEHGFVGTYYIITSCVGSGDYMNMSDLHALQAAGNEIASHSVAHPIFTNLTDSQINYECNASKQFLQDNGFSATNFAYPSGYSNSHVDSIVLKYYRSARYSAAGGYLMPIPPTSIQMSIPMGFPGETGDSTALAKNEEIVRLAQETNSWVIIFFHNILSTPLTTPWEIERSNFAAFLNYLGNSSVQVKTINQALNLWSSPQRVTVLPSSTTMDVGQGQAFTASAYGGTGPYTYKWFLGGNSVGTNSPSYTFNPSSAGLFSIFVNATDSAGVPVTVKSNNASVTVYSAPTVSVSPTTWVMDVGQSRTFTASALGGSGSYTNYQWYVGGVAQSGATASTFSYSPGSVGSYLITVTVTDSLGVTSVQSSAASVTVNASPTVNVSPVGPLTMDVGQQQSFTATASGGTGTKSYQWYLDGSIITGQTASSYLYTAALTSHTLYVRVTDSASSPVMTQSNIVSVTVNDAPIASIAPLSWVMDVGQSRTFTASALGGSGSYTNYQWYVGGVAQSGATASTFSYSPGSVGSYLITVTVTDSLGVTSVQSSAASVTVNASPTVNVSPVGPLTMDVGQQQSFTATASGGTGTKSYQWYLDGSIITGQTASSYLYTAALTSHTLYVRVTDSASSPVMTQSNIVSVTVNDAPIASIAPLSWVMDVGQSRTFTASALGGSGSYTNYQWYVGGVAQSGATASTFSYSPGSVGSYLITVTVTDSLGVTSVQSSAASVTVNASPTVNVSPVGPLTMDVGQQQSFTATASGGTGTKSYQWYLDGSIITGQTASSYLYTAALTSHTLYVRVTDSASSPVMTQSNIVSVTVNDAPIASIAPLSWVMDVGQSRTFTASALGGSGSYTNYQWYVGGVAQSGATASTFSYSPGSVGSYLITVTVTDSLGVTSVQSSAASVTVNPALVTPTLSVSAFTVNRGQTSNFTSSAFSTGTSPYTYQWLQKDPIGSFLPISGATSNSYSFDASIDTAFGSWSFELRVTDATGAQVTSSFISVVVNPIISVFASAGGSIIPAGNVNVNYGSSQSFTIKANANYYIIDVSVNGSSVGSVNSYTFNNIQDSYGIFATFAPEPTLSPSPTATPISTPIPTSTLMPPIEGYSTPSPIPVASPTTSSTTTPHPTPSSRYTQSPTVPKFSIFTLSILIMSILVLAVAARKKQARI